MNLATPIALIRLCGLAAVSRAGFYRWKAAAPEMDPDLELRDRMQRIAVEFSYYGSRRIRRELRRQELRRQPGLWQPALRARPTGPRAATVRRRRARPIWG